MICHSNEAQQAEIEALQKRFAQASAEFAEKIRAYEEAAKREQDTIEMQDAVIGLWVSGQEQAAVNPAHNSSMVKEGSGAGAPPAITEEAKKEMRREAVLFLKEFLDEKGIYTGIAEPICKAIYANKIPHVRFCYEV